MTKPSDFETFLKLLVENKQPIYTDILRHSQGFKQARVILQDTVQGMWFGFEGDKKSAEFVRWGIEIACRHFSRGDRCREDNDDSSLEAVRLEGDDNE